MRIITVKIETDSEESFDLIKDDIEQELSCCWNWFDKVEISEEGKSGMDDLISRQALINKINERQRKLIYCFGFDNDIVKTMDIAKSIVNAIPSEQQNTKGGRMK